MVVAIIASIVLLALFTLGDSSATLRVQVLSTESVTVDYNLYIDGSRVKSGSIAPFGTDAFERTFEWSSFFSKKVVVSVTSSAEGPIASIFSDKRTVSLSDGDHDVVTLIV